MAVSGSFDFSLNRDALIKKALLMLGVISADQTPTSSEVTSASNSLNLLLKAWQADGMQLWRVTQVSISPPTASASYTFGDSTYTDYQPVDILDVYRVNTSADTWVKLNRYSRDKFYQLSDHDSTGTPVAYYYNNDNTNGTLTVWPIADTTFISDYTLEVFLTKPFDDMDSSTDNLAFPQYWELAVVYGLATILAPEYGVPIADQKLLITMATKIKHDAMMWDTEHTSIFLMPSYQMTGDRNNA